MLDNHLSEIRTCYNNPHYFINTYCYIEDSITKSWIPFALWPAQEQVITAIHNEQFFIALKARQVGFTWLALAYGLYLILFQPIQQINIFSKREREAVHLLHDRMKGIYNRLPDWLKSKSGTDSKTEWSLANGSTVRALPTDIEGAGDTYTATLAIFDEADLTDKFHTALTSIMPSIEAGGKLVIFSRPNKRKPESHFKKIFSNAMNGENGYAWAFMPWHAHPARDRAWYDKIARTLSKDELWEQYPETIQQALALASMGLVYPEFDIKLNVTPEADYEPGYPIYWSVDDGYTDPRSIGLWQIRPCQGRPDRVCRFAEHVAAGETADQAIDAVLKLNYPKPDIIYYDPAAVQFAAEAYNHYALYTQAGYNKVQDGIKVVRRFVCDGNAERRLLIHPRCRSAVDALKFYHWSESVARIGGEPRPDHDTYSHSADDIRYFIATHLYTA